jgi:hypothetical protein
MRAAPRLAWIGAVLCGFVALASAAFAEGSLQTQFVPAPPKTGGSGSCLYGGSGELLHAPPGVECPAREQPPAKLAPAATRGASVGLPESVRAESRALLAEREALDVELARVRQAVGYEDREAAARVVNEALARIARHLEREARLLQPLAAGGTAP